MIEYHFKAINDFEYSIDFKGLATSNKYLEKLFNMTRKKVEVTKGISIKSNLSEIEEFEIPNIYHNLIITSLKPKIKQVKKQVMEDGIKLISDRIYLLKFIKDNNKWKIKLIIKGEYVQE